VAVLADTRSRFVALGEADEVRATDRVLAELLLDAGLPARAGAVLEPMTDAHPAGLSAAECRVVGRHHLAEGRVLEAREWLRRGVALATQEAHRYEEGLLRLEMAEALRLDGEPYAAELGDAREILRSMGVVTG
jgi:hypothetical protein